MQETGLQGYLLQNPCLDYEYQYEEVGAGVCKRSSKKNVGGR